jgi:hypothetical protein
MMHSAVDECGNGGVVREVASWSPVASRGPRYRPQVRRATARQLSTDPPPGLRELSLEFAQPPFPAGVPSCCPWSSAAGIHLDLSIIAMIRRHAADDGGQLVAKRGELRLTSHAQCRESRSIVFEAREVRQELREKSRP